MARKRDHGGGLDGAMARWGGQRADWLDLSTGINPVPYPVGAVKAPDWTALPDQAALTHLLSAARRFWDVPEGAQVVAAPGTSALIARMPWLTHQPGAVYIPGPTYNEHAAAFRGAWGACITEIDDTAPVHIYVHPNNPDGRLWPDRVIADRPLTIIDESFCDIAPGCSHVGHAVRPGVVVLKSFGKFWGLAGLRLGFAIAAPQTLAGLEDQLGPWAVSGPALTIGARALADRVWADATRMRLTDDAARLDRLAAQAGLPLVGGTSLFRLYETANAAACQGQLGQARILSRIFPYSDRWIRLGLPGTADDWDRLEEALT
ncbi:threonine-phosphate decarboxylase [Actibacterium sp. 188UL27-1]|uniref:threonine-phosphate decarboxylase n=1 Tax=Actibacterium sp. 188UL27-1 TaxID=2786961 RepID=UPI0019594677|nr:threonine-phosphate decarboxylase [Actibacterium sp. 188UL27-1]MBM7068630.1 pyridoxal phosphate-dependent class II aminotransferase [Actibacterium sp. 188UL27-1]